MPNICSYEMKIKGSKTAIFRVIGCLKADYDYSVGGPSRKHFFRIFDVYPEDEAEENNDGTFTLFISGTCAWSVYSCMCKGLHTYYNDCKERHPDTFMGTTLQEQSQDCEIEVFSEEPGNNFTEHYLYKNGECLLDGCCELDQKEDENGDWVCLNPYRENGEDIYRWTL